ncbi:DNA gyrase, A subunit (plasmid) [Thioalkalivibrio sp. K90mix]|uniref:DNA gyrase subunit A n=1 Tax=Thioalkalivibrio sp. (strain K90mix) TaxID=396595 RepID=UPI000195A685|nr:DNA gyrase subunit A [Thioalkalivibrio sp. K90mix]ADC73255.1 DNA gyrase, A subunit [Thioalkalivibrio sp. K90mix]
MTEVIDPEAGASNAPLELEIGNVMRSSFADYAMSVITDRALPDARDGLKPVHRRILYSMHQLGITHMVAHKKSARVVGDVLGKYHPHGDSACYDSAVRMAQHWAMRHPLIDGQGNFGSIDGDNAAAMRYTEMRLSKLGTRLFADIQKNTVDFRDNFDGTEREPEVLPLTYPNLLVNGSEGIAVGMATSVPPHNLRETADAFLAWLDNPEITTREIAQHMPGPDFPTGGILHDLDGYIQALDTGRGAVKLRSQWTVEDRPRGGSRLVIDQIPYAVNKAKLVEQIAELVREKKIEGVADLRDESNKKGIRIVLEIKREFEAEAIAFQLVTMTQLETSVRYNIMALVGQTPMQLGVRDLFEHFRAHRIEVIQRRTQFDLDRALDRLHILEGLLMALDRLDETIATIRASADADEARGGLIDLLGIDVTQAQAILDMKLQKLTGLQIQDIRDEHDRLTAEVADLRDILARSERQVEIMRTELLDLCDQHANERCTEIDTSLSKVSAADLIPEEDVMLIGTQQGYLKRIAAKDMNRQNRGTKGRSIMSVGEDDLVTTFHAGHSHDTLIALTDSGQVHAIKAYDIPDTGLGNKGRHYRNVFEGVEGNVVAMLTVDGLESVTHSLVIFTAQGLVKRTPLSAYSNATRRGGIQGISLVEGDSIVCARVSKDEPNESVIVAADNAKAIRFGMEEARAIGRTSRGVRAMNLSEDARVVAGDIIHADDLEKAHLMVVSEKGLGKATPASEFRLQSRGGKGVTSYTPNKRSGPVVAATVLFEGADVVLFNDQGGANRIAGSDVPHNGRATTGSAIIRNGSVRNVLAVPPPVEEDQ